MLQNAILRLSQALVGWLKHWIYFRERIETGEASSIVGTLFNNSKHLAWSAAQFRFHSPCCKILPVWPNLTKDFTRGKLIRSLLEQKGKRKLLHCFLTLSPSLFTLLITSTTRSSFYNRKKWAAGTWKLWHHNVVTVNLMEGWMGIIIQRFALVQSHFCKSLASKQQHQNGGDFCICHLTEWLGILQLYTTLTWLSVPIGGCTGECIGVCFSPGPPKQYTAPKTFFKGNWPAVSPASH